MFNWFRNKHKGSNVVPFPETKTMPYIQPTEPKEKPVTTFYRIGLTDNNRVSFNMGYSEITMTKLGVQQMIEQLEVFMNQLPDQDGEDGQPD